MSGSLRLNEKNIWIGNNKRGREEERKTTVPSTVEYDWQPVDSKRVALWRSRRSIKPSSCSSFALASPPLPPFPAA